MTEQRDILLVPFPFSDQSGKKVRPVLILSCDDYNNQQSDLLVCAITSKPGHNRYILKINNSNLEEGKLFVESYIRADSILKINKELIIKNIGKLNKENFNKIKLVLKKIFGI